MGLELDDEEPAVSSFGKWVAGIVSGVLVAVIATLVVGWMSGPADPSSDVLPGPGVAEIFLNKDSGPPGSKVLVSGEGFGRGEKVTLRFHTQEVARCVVDEQGHFAEVSVQVPKNWHFTGPFDFLATGNTSSRFASRSFRVT